METYLFTTSNQYQYNLIDCILLGSLLCYNAAIWYRKIRQLHSLKFVFFEFNMSSISCGYYADITTIGVHFHLHFMHVWFCFTCKIYSEGPI